MKIGTLLKMNVEWKPQANGIGIRCDMIWYTTFFGWIECKDARWWWYSCIINKKSSIGRWRSIQNDTIISMIMIAVCFLYSLILWSVFCFWWMGEEDVFVCSCKWADFCASNKMFVMPNIFFSVIWIGPCRQQQQQAACRRQRWRRCRQQRSTMQIKLIFCETNKQTNKTHNCVTFCLCIVLYLLNRS